VTTEVSELLTTLRLKDETAAGLAAANDRLRKVAEEAGKAEKGIGGLGAGVKVADREFTAAGRSVAAINRSIDGTATAAAAAGRVLRQHAADVEKLRIQHEREGRTAAETAEALRRLDLVRDQGLAKARAMGARVEAQFLGQSVATRQATESLGRFGSVADQVTQAATGMASRLGPAGASLASFGPGAAVAVAGLVAVTGALVAIARAGDQAVATLGKLQAVTGSASAARDVYEQLYQSSQKTGVAVADAAGTFSRFQIAASEIGATRDQVLRLVEGLQKVAIVSGTSGQEGAAAMQQLGQALASGKLNGDELRSLMENMPALAQQLARELDTNIGQLRKMGEEGTLTADKVFPALLKATEKMAADFEKMPMTMSRAFDILGASMLNFTAKLDEALGLSQAIARAVKAAADAVNGVRRVVLPTERETLESGRSAARSRMDGLSAQIANAGDIRGLGIGQLASPADRTLNVNSLRQEHAKAEAEWRSYNERLAEIDKEGQADRFGQFVTAQGKAAEAARTHAAADFLKVQEDNDKLLKLDRDYLKEQQAIDAAERTGAATAGDVAAARLALARSYYDERKRITDALSADDRKAEKAGESAAAKAAKAAQAEIDKRQGVIDKLDEQVAAAERSVAATAEGEKGSKALALALEVENKLREAGIPALEKRTAAEKAAAEVIEGRVRQLDKLKTAQTTADEQIKKTAEFQDRSWRELGNIGERAFDRLGDAIVDAFVSGRGAAVNFGNVAKGIIASLLTDLAKLAVINPILNSIFVSSQGLRPTLAGAVGGAGGAGGGFGGVGNLLSSGWSSLSSGWSALTSGGYLGGGGGFSGAMFGSAGFEPSIATGMMGQAPTSGLIGSGGSFSMSSLGSTLGGIGAGFGLGTFANSLLGGNSTNGMIGSGIGSAAGAIFGPVGSMIGGTLGGAVGGMFGPGPSVQGWGLRLQSSGRGPDNTDINEMGDGLLPISRQFYNASGAQTFAQADQLVTGLNAFLKERNLRVGGVSIVGGNKNGADYSWADAGSLSEAFTRLRFDSKDNPELTRSLAGKVFDDPAKLQQWVDGFLQAQEAIAKLGEPPLSTFAASLENLNKTFDEAIKTAQMYGLAEGGLNTERERQIALLEAERAETLRTSQVSMQLRRLAVQGRDDEAALLQQSEAATAELRAFGKQLDDLAVSAAEKGALMLELEELQAAERLKIIRDFGEQANAALRQSGASIRAYVDEMRAGESGGASPTDRLVAAQNAFGADLALARGGNKDALGRITGAADNLLAAGRDMFGSGTQFQAMRTFVLQSLESIPAVKSYDQEMLEALQALGGGIDVSVGIEVVRVISETLNALPDATKATLVQAQTVVRDVQERIGRYLTAAEVGALVASQVILRDVRQSMQRDLSPAERAGLVAGAVILRDIKQSMQRDLSPAERAGLVAGAVILRNIQQVIGRDLSAAERAGLVQGATVLRGIEQAMGRDLTAAERAGIIVDDVVTRAIEQAMGRDLSAAERAGLVQSQTILRAIEQGFGRNLSVAERASLVQATQVLWTIEQRFGRNLSIAERDSLIQSSQVLWSIEQSIGRNLTAEEAASLVEGEDVARIIEQSLGRQLTAEERAGLVAAGNIMRTVEQQLGRALTAEEKASIVQGGNVLRGVFQAVQEPTGADLIAPEGHEPVLRGIFQAIQTATGATLLLPENINRIIRQAVETTETIQISRSIDDKLGNLLTAIRDILALMKGDLSLSRIALQAIRNDAGEGGGGDRFAAKGLVFRASNVVPFAKGGIPDVVSQPHIAPFAVFGEAGPEAIVPLTRMPNGDLGVSFMGGDGIAADLQAAANAYLAQLVALMEEVRDAMRATAAMQATVARDGFAQNADAIQGLRTQLVRMGAAA
jgi:tape measure domain-containing protein